MGQSIMRGYFSAELWMWCDALSSMPGCMLQQLCPEGGHLCGVKGCSLPMLEANDLLRLDRSLIPALHFGDLKSVAIVPDPDVANVRFIL